MYIAVLYFVLGRVKINYVATLMKLNPQKGTSNNRNATPDEAPVPADAAAAAVASAAAAVSPRLRLRPRPAPPP